MPSRSASEQNPVVGMLHCQCGKVMKVRRRSIGRPGKCRQCGNLLRADLENLAPVPKRADKQRAPEPTPAQPGAAASDEEWQTADSAVLPLPLEPGEGDSDVAPILPADDRADDAAIPTAPEAVVPSITDEAPATADVDAADGEWAADEGTPEAADAAWTVSDSASEEWFDDEEAPGQAAPAAEVDSPSEPGADDWADEAAGFDGDTDPFIEMPAGEEPEDSGDDQSPSSAPADADAFATAPDAEARDADADVGDAPATEVLERPAPKKARDLAADSWDVIPAREPDGLEGKAGDTPPAPRVQQPDGEPGATDAESPLRAPPPPSAGQTAWDQVAPPAAASQGATSDQVSPDTLETTAPPEPAPLPPGTTGATGWDGVAPPETRPLTQPPAVRPVGTERTNWDAMAPTKVGQPPVPPGPGSRQSPDVESSGVADPFEDSFGDSLSSWAGAQQGGWDLPADPAESPTPDAKSSSPDGSPGAATAAPRPAIPRTRVGKRRPPWSVFPLCLVSASVYYFIWVYLVCCELRDHLVREKAISPGLLLGLHVVPFLTPFLPYYVLYRISADINLMQVLEGQAPAISPAGVVGMALGGTLVMMAGSVLAVESGLGWLMVVGGLGLWGVAFGQVQHALNRHWALH